MSFFPCVRFLLGARLISLSVGKCNPAEKVPKSWCFKQFYNMCRNSKKKNATVLARYGSAGCQQWQLLEKDYQIPSGKNS